MILVNLFGAPGAGKSTGAAYVFARLKMAGINAELVTEYAKDKVWEENKAVFNNQAYIFGKQFFRISRLEDKVDVVVTDSPLLLSCYYGKDDPRLGYEFNALVRKVSESYSSINAFLHRVKPYNPNGRFQTEEESNKVSKDILRLLEYYGVEFSIYPGSDIGYDALADHVLETLNRKHE